MRLLFNKHADTRQFSKMLEFPAAVEGRQTSVESQGHGVRRGCKLQDRGAGQGCSESRLHVVALHRGRREARLARGVIREYEAFLGHKMRGPAGTGRGGVSMVGGR